jgi:uncharacterized membrane protein
MPHPAIAFGSLALLCGTFLYQGQNGLHEAWIDISVALVVVLVCAWSMNKRVKEINQKYSQRTARQRRQAPVD